MEADESLEIKIKQNKFHLFPDLCHKKMLLELLDIPLTLTIQNRSKSYRDFLQKRMHVVLCNHPNLSIGTEKLDCLNNLCDGSRDTCLVRGRLRVRPLAPTGALQAFFSPPSLPPPLMR